MRNIISFSFLIIALLLPFMKASAQDTIVFMNGKTRNARVFDISEKAIKYHFGTSEKSAIHSIKSYRVFSVNKGNGTEELVFKPDTTDGQDYTIPQLRLFIKGENAAQTGYNNRLNKTLSFIAGAGASYFSIYGLVIPALYSSIVGSRSPDMSRQRNVDPNYVNVPEYKEGYLTIARNKKIRNSFVSGMIGYGAGFLAQAITRNNPSQLNTVIIGFGIGFTAEALMK